MEGSNRDIYLVSSNGGQHHKLTTDPAEDTCPSWSRDGRWIYFGSGRSGSLQIWKMPSAGGRAVQVTTKGGFEGFESPDGTVLLLRQRAGRPWHLANSGERRCGNSRGRPSWGRVLALLGSHRGGHLFRYRRNASAAHHRVFQLRSGRREAGRDPRAAGSVEGMGLLRFARSPVDSLHANRSEQQRHHADGKLSLRVSRRGRCCLRAERENSSTRRF